MPKPAWWDRPSKARHGFGSEKDIIPHDRQHAETTIVKIYSLQVYGLSTGIQGVPGASGIIEPSRTAILSGFPLVLLLLFPSPLPLDTTWSGLSSPQRVSHYPRLRIVEESARSWYTGVVAFREEVRDLVSGSDVSEAAGEFLVHNRLSANSYAQRLLAPARSHPVSPTILKPWQVTDESWMLQQEDMPIHGSILADACGLGKTLTALALIYPPISGSIPPHAYPDVIGTDRYMAARD
ncbi:hypothetical protein PENFLA_c035G03070 [Penicillium flavigenum]|uniref:SNF2 N-terminal domain-containing protein n=1 Tax=Penicillium flavigenum TaxID=254877 RepID=A0A1V6SLB5_9EURO|nr:hypothetical protein PENFLA_c035G03070 [Penicillium flavigenum]